MALLDGVKYGLSSQANQSGNKTVIFVKLTDSALKAIDDYLKGQHKPGQRANLRFLGNEGTIHIPSSTSDNGHSFDFSLSTNTDVESPQGSFECIQQCGTKVLQSAGPLSYKMRIKANDDVFVQTQNRFTELEHERRQECAKEIKSNCAYIGRKVKNKINLPPIPQQRRKPSPNYISQHQQQPKYPLSAPSFANSSSNSHKLPNGFSSGSNNNNRKTVNGISNGNHQSAPSSVNGPSKPATNPPTHDVSRRPLKERLIHMLAVRPYKKPELFQRLNSDGLKDRDKKILMPILQQVSSFKDNEYSLLRGVWNDVQEDWPFYTEQEKQLMKRRKPQNLTPPGSDSSVGSGTSSLSPRSNSPVGPGHSPSNYSQINHNHSSSFHKVASGPTDSESKGIKRPVNSGILPEGVEDYGDIPNKKTRVSHFKKPGSGGNSSPGNGANSLISSRSEVITKQEKDISSGSSPQFTSHNNRIAERLSPIRSSGSGSHLSVPNGLNGATHSVSNNHRSPRNGNFESMEVSPSHGSTISNGYHNNSSAQGDAAVEESVSVGSSWQSRNGNDAHGLSDSEKVGRGDSDETDSVDSGNGSSSSSGSSASQHNHNPSYNGSKEKDVHHGGYSNGGATMKVEKSEFISSSANNNVNAKSSSLMNGCNRVSSTTNFHSTPQSSPDSQVDAMQLLQQQKCQLNSKDNASTAVSKQRFNGKCNFEPNPEIIITRDKGCERETHRDRDRERDRSSRRNDRDRGKERERDKERSKDRGKKSGDRKHSRKSDDQRDEHSYEIEDTDGSTVKISSEYPSYLTKYTAIANTEERSRYKDDFNAEYATYRDLHAVIDKVSKRFAHLEERLRQEERGTEGYEKIKDQIVNEYYANKRDKKYQDTRQRFLYLHEKLSHIKRLVSDYDAHQQDQELPNDYPNGFVRP